MSLVLYQPPFALYCWKALIALYERAVGIYAELINVNAYHQPAVNKAAATPILELQSDAAAEVARARRPVTAENVAERIGRPQAAETVCKLLERMAREPRRRIGALPAAGGNPRERRFYPIRPGQNTGEVTDG